MLHVISPAKTLDFTIPALTAIHTQPEFLDDARLLIDELRQLQPLQVSTLMGISGKLAELNVQRFQNWQTPFTEQNSKQAVLAFKGDVYMGMEVETFSNADMRFAQKHLRILSGLYGLLKPLDLIQAYRLEMGTRLVTSRGHTLYHFWGEKITAQLNKELDQRRQKVLINLASAEYFSAINPSQVNGLIINPIFKERKNGSYKIVSFFAKRARGMMCAYLVKNRIMRVEDIKGFNYAGYAFNKALSTDTKWVFTRNQE